MSERTKLLKKALLTGPGATTNGERLKDSVKEALDDLVKIGQELLGELESRGKVKTKSAKEFLSHLQDEAKHHSESIGGRVSSEVHRIAHDCGLATHDELEALSKRVAALEKKSASARKRKATSS